MVGLGNWFNDKLPSWVRHQPVLPPEVKAELNKEYQIPIRDSRNTVRGWRDMGVTYEVAHGEPFKDSRTTAAIRVFDPDMIPMTIRWTFMEPAPSTRLETFVRHAIGRYIASPHYHHEPLGCVLPPIYTGPVPNQIDLIWSGELFGMKDPRGVDLPGDFLPWDSRLLHFMEQAFNWHKNHSITEMKERFIYEPLKRKALKRQKNREEQHYINRDLEKYITKQLSKLGEPEIQAYFMGGKFRKPEKKVMLGVGKPSTTPQNMVLGASVAPSGIIVPGATREPERPTKQPTLPRTLYTGGGEPVPLK